MPNPLFVEIRPEQGGWLVEKPGHSTSTVYGDLGAALDDAAEWAAGSTLVRILVREASKPAALFPSSELAA